jgi:hypothetical protein
MRNLGMLHVPESLDVNVWDVQRLNSGAQRDYPLWRHDVDARGAYFADAMPKLSPENSNSSPLQFQVKFSWNSGKSTFALCNSRRSLPGITA